MTELKLDSSLVLRINENIRLEISNDGILINDFSAKSKVIVTGGDKMDMIHHDNTHTLHFKFQEVQS